ncbi:uncharacterized protein LOC127807329 isoform X2 [Diospyros lotus]|nr:uncharacterized protein LOC127807329 isoform X2 [Diospyros lotus]XP_052201021.1 uncharacterized protein LOC127807329 isoform X2 [Diospyros lotus]
MVSPQQLKRRVNSTPKRKQIQTTPKKKVINGGLRDACPGLISDNTIQSGNATRAIPDLRLEEKMKAEENARIFGGRQMHPFFSSRKIAKKNQEVVDVESYQCCVERKDISTTFSPVHVFEEDHDDSGSLDWGNWKLSERSFISTTCDLKSLCSPVPERSVSALHFDDFLNVCLSSRPLPRNGAIQHEEVSLDRSPVQSEHRHATSPILSADEPVVHSEVSKDIEVGILPSSLQCWQDNILEKSDLLSGNATPVRNLDGAWEDCKMEKTDLLSGNAAPLRNSDIAWEGRFLHERMTTYYHSCGKCPENSLWTNKYLPEKAFEVCGNVEPVNFLSEWLRLWSGRGFKSTKDFTAGKKFALQDDDYYCCSSDSDYENRDDENDPKNVLLVTGPVGSGKSAAIYACAKEQGFQVIEVNTSDWRTRSHVMQRFEGGVESYSVQRTLENPVGSERKSLQKSLPVIFNTTAVEGSDSEVLEPIPLSYEEQSQVATGTPGKFICEENIIATDQSENKPLILFEDVDAVLSEDHGLISTIQKLAETAKRPIILTSNNSNPILPNNWDRLELCFNKPSMKELLFHVYMVCAAEKVKLQPCLLEQFIECCQGDIRKTIMHLQFWCQGQRSRKESERHRMYGSLLFDIDAGHRMLPKIVPWGYPSQLSEIVEKEISKSLMMEESSKLMEEVTEGEVNETNTQQCSKIENIEAKKEEILRSHCPVQDGIELKFQPDTACEFSNSFDSPVAFPRRHVRRKLETVLSSSSEDERLNDTFPVVRDKLFEDANNEMFLEVDSRCPYGLPIERYSNTVAEPLLQLNSKPKNLEESFNLFSEQLVNSKEEAQNCSQCSESALFTQTKGTSKSVDVSCVPESSFVPETEINNVTSLFCGTASCGNVTDTVEAISTSNHPIQNENPVETVNQSISALHPILETVENFNIYMQSIQGEEVGDSQTEHVEAVSRGYLGMDECSRMDFSRGIECHGTPRLLTLKDYAQEAWRRIRGCHTDIRHHVTREEKDASVVLKHAYGMSHLISEVDILFGNCQMLICDSLEPSMIPSERSHSFRWYDDQLWMSSTIAQHGICFYAKQIAAAGLNNGCVSRMDLASEMLACSSSTMALGKLVGQERRIESSDMRPLRSIISIKRELDSNICSVVQSIVPSRLYLATKGDAFYEYLSSLGQISRSEASRLSESSGKTKQRRRHVARSYLSTDGLMLSPDDISLLGRYNCYGKL